MLEAILIGTASYRVFRLIAVDAITEKPREWVLVHTPRWVEEMTECPWCLGSWLAFACTWATDAVVGLSAPFLTGLAAAVVVGALGSLLE